MASKDGFILISSGLGSSVSGVTENEKGQQAGETPGHTQELFSLFIQCFFFFFFLSRKNHVRWGRVIRRNTECSL